MAIDRARGCTIRFHPAGFRIVMYKDTPGVYFNERGEPANEKLAGQAGFDVAVLRKEKLKRERMAQYQAKVEAEFATEQDDVENLLSAPEDGLTVKHIGKGKYAIFDADGERLTKKPLTKAESQNLMDDLKPRGDEDDGSPT